MRPDRSLILLYSLTLFVNAALLFIIEPMVAKMILPYLGGSPAVWNTSLAFYQGALLTGYAYAHYLSGWIGIKRHALLHLGLVVAAISVLPVSLPTQWFSIPSAHPTQLVLGALLAAVGFPFFVIAAGAPLLQKWFALCRHKAARDPYFLYAASNAGSLAGLLAYPFLIEPYLTLKQQNTFWFYGYAGLALLIAGCLLGYLSSQATATQQVASADRAPAAQSDSRADDGAPIPLARRLRWLLWSLVPSSLLCGVTTYITTDVVSAPLFWVVPLAAYLLSFIIAFGAGSWVTGGFMARRQSFLLIAAALTVAVGATNPVSIVLPLHLLAFFITALLCHGRLAQDRPPPRYLTEFYLWISLGGVVGGLFNALLAPQIFSTVVEYPLMMAAAAFMRPLGTAEARGGAGRIKDFVLPLLLGAVMVALIELAQRVPSLSRYNLHLAVFGITGMVCLSFANRPARFGLSVIALFAIASRFPPQYGQELFRDRSFFGAYRATEDVGNKRRNMFHGTTIHGAQNSDPAVSLTPLSYHHRTGPAGQVLLAKSGAAARKVGLVGLGIGALACHGAAGQEYIFFEIDPLVEKIARDARLFTYLRDCAPKVQVVIGDARLTLAKAPDQGFDILLVDAFSSDVIPVHLLTQQALELYWRKTAADGLLLIHISNRYMDLAPVLDRLAQELKLTALLQDDFDLSAADMAAGKSPSRWVLLARHGPALQNFAADPRWRRLDGKLGGQLWTDEFSDILSVLRWR